MSERVFKVGPPIETESAGITSLVAEDPWRNVYPQGTTLTSTTPLFVFGSLQAALDFARPDPVSRRVWVARTPQTFDPPLYIPHMIGDDMTSEGWLEFWDTWRPEQNTAQFFRQGWQRDTTAVRPGTRICYELEVLYEVRPVELAAYWAFNHTLQAPTTIAVAVFHEQIVLHTARTLIGSDINGLSEALGYIGDCCLAYDIIHHSGLAGVDMTYLAFYLDPLSIQGTVFRAMELLEMQCQQKQPADSSYTVQDTELVRTLVDQAAGEIRQPTLTWQQAFVQLLSCGPYMTARGPVYVRWNNTSCHEVCPFCGDDFKPSWGLWAFLQGLAGSPICLECWQKGNTVIISTDAPTVAADPHHLHVLEPGESAGQSGTCACGAYWTLEDGWWKLDTTGTWCRETSCMPAP